MSPEDKDELILRHLAGETTKDEGVELTQLLKDDPQFRSRFHAFVTQVARLREILDDRFSDKTVNGKTPVEVGMSMQPSVASPRRSPKQTLPEIAPPVQRPEWNLEFRRIYFNAVIGGSGGLLGWLLVALIGSLVSLDTFNVYLRDAIVGLIVGVSIGFAAGSTEGIVASKSWRRAFRGGLWGAALGAGGGFAGLILGELIFGMAGGGVWPRAIGWAIFGACVGTSDGFAQRITAKIRYGVLGGLLGGLIGGSAYEGLLAIFRGAGGRAAALAWGSAVGLVILGACIGALVGLVEALLRKSWLFFVTGRMEGQTRTLDSSRPHTIGSDDSCDIVVNGDPSVAPVHAEFHFANGDFEIRARDGEVTVRRDGVDQLALTYLLQPGDRILLGETRMVFRNVEGKKS
ncbi:MAG: FHA domain-containing protein [Gemmataceae bacterium]|nr:FHA domain-containing protein [Gemmataceae bacterium]